jgi:hypothetical protein
MIEKTFNVKCSAQPVRRGERMEQMGCATWPVKPRGSGRARRERPRYNGADGS